MEDILGIEFTTTFNYSHYDRRIILFYFKINEDSRFYVQPSELKQIRLIAGVLNSMLCCS
jgi:hypothetical protein